jgi:aerobic-type carbon monoxide dehydrogenase small subunit (CoxS/CutS family)
MLMSAKALLMADPHPTEEAIRLALAGNLCRCTGYTTIVAAVRAASEQPAESSSTPPALDSAGRDV